jgi:hypothetical protein
MRMFSWRWTLALLQIVIAFAAIVYAPYEYRSRPHLIGDCTLTDFRKVWPPPVLRVCYMLNFPALTAAIPIRLVSWSGRHLVEYRGPLYISSLSVDDCMFLAAVGVLWFCLGNMIDHRNRRTAAQPKRSRVVSLIIGLLFSSGMIALAIFYTMLTGADQPFREIGAAGLVWALALFWYFVSNLIRISRTAAGQIEHI